MIDDTIEIAPETRNGTIGGSQVMFRAYIASDRTQRLVWKVDDTTGNGAMMDKLEGIVILPQGREIEVDGRTSHYIDIPRWLADALMNDFENFEADSIDPLNDATNDQSPEDEDDDEITPMFDDIEVDDGSNSD